MHSAAELAKTLMLKQLEPKHYAWLNENFDDYQKYHHRKWEALAIAFNEEFALPKALDGRIARSKMLTYWVCYHLSFLLIIIVVIIIMQIIYIWIIFYNICIIIIIIIILMFVMYL